MSRKALTSIQVYTIKKPGFHRDPMTVGLYLQVARSKTGVSRSWAYRYNSPLTGKLRFMGLGSVDVVSLADARKLAQDYRRMVRIERRDPVEERRAMKAEALKASASAMTFAQCVDAYIAQHGKTWKNDKHRKQWRSTLDRACDAFGKIVVADVSAPMIVTLLTPIWGSHTRNRLPSACAGREGLRLGQPLPSFARHRIRRGGKVTWSIYLRVRSAASITPQCRGLRRNRPATFSTPPTFGRCYMACIRCNVFRDQLFRLPIADPNRR